MKNEKIWTLLVAWNMKLRLKEIGREVLYKGLVLNDNVMEYEIVVKGNWKRSTVQGARVE